MKQFFYNIILLSLLIINNNFSQDYYTGVNKFSISILPTFESWSANTFDFSEFTNVFSVKYLPVRNTTLALAARYASVGGDINDLNGFSDTQLFLSQRLPDYNLVLNGGLNIPSGKTKLRPDEFLASRVISQNLFSMKTPNFGQGLNIFLGFTWVYTVLENFVIGAGFSYQIKNEYQPLDDPSGKYNPSNEISLTTGFDVRLNKTSTITGDVTGIFYSSDKLDGEEIFSSGNRIVSSLMYRQYFEYNFLTALLLYRNIAVDELKGIFSFIEAEKFNPNQFYFSLAFNQRFTPEFLLEYGIFGSLYEETAAFYSGYNLYGISLSSEFKISSRSYIPIILKFARGSANGKPDLQRIEIGTGIKFSL